MDIDAFAPRLSFFWGIGMNFYMVCTLLVVFFTIIFYYKYNFYFDACYVKSFLTGNSKTQSSENAVGASNEEAF